MMSLILVIIMPCLIPQVTRCHQPDSVHLQMKSDTTVMDLMKRFKRQAAAVGSGASFANSSPVLEGPPQINVTVNDTAHIQLNASDIDSQNVSYVIMESPTTGFSLNQTTQTMTWTPNSTDPVNLQAYVQDEGGAQSNTLRNNVMMCSGCSGHGTCDFTQSQKTTNDGYYMLAVCDCEPWYDGDNCEKNFNACFGDPCPALTNCTDLTPDEHKNAGYGGLGYNCSSCPNGFVLNSTVYKCHDEDECTTKTPCEHNCTNTFGSYTCSCNAGYRLDSVSKSACRDIDECVENTHKCDQVCSNTIGSNNCGCFPGFTLNNDTFTCNKTAQQDPCLSLSKICSYACVNNSGTAECVCPAGYRVDGSECKDIDECEQRICPQKCKNTNGSFICSCYAGYEMNADKISCRVCPDMKYGVDCKKECKCRGRGTCDRVRGCRCDAGWTGEFCTVDVDECLMLAKPCPDGQICENTNGSYTCNCPSGYTKANESELCININECSQPDLNKCNQLCEDTNGSYVCTCKSGYKFDITNTTCLDIDECATDTSGCEQICTNFPGTVNCGCFEGFVLADDRKECAKVKDCERLGENLSCTYGCEVLPSGQGSCFCPKGFQLTVDGATCVDINECIGNNACSQTCENLLGGYRCKCRVGFTLESDQRTCIDCRDLERWGDNCINNCSCNPLGSEDCDPVTGCRCKDGWRGTNCDQDRDECAGAIYPCSTNENCINTEGSYRCECNTGYVKVLSNSTCEDIDECLNDPCDQTCSNTIGSYSCSCFTGFIQDGDNCIDIDECLNNPCSHLCRNTAGGFACDCFPGYTLNVTSRTSCILITQCGSNSCDHGCRINNFSQECFCKAGYNLNATDNATCIDIDECQPSPCINGTCNNLPGTFNCSCPPGSTLLSDGLTCQVCQEGKFGDNCQSNCTCNMTNTLTCDKVNGSCSCRTGWNGATCSDDIDECQNASICQSVTHSSCKNTPGAYECACDVGFFQSKRKCYACDSRHWGLECSKTCDCVTANTVDCNDTTGVCTCNRFWTGANCSVDVDECLSNPCLQNEECNNFKGGFDCNCKKGYERPSSGDNCTDINECLLANLNKCNRSSEICTNTVGSYNCSCKPGFIYANGICQDQGCRSILHNCSQLCNNSNSYKCSCLPGYTLNSDETTCDACLNGTYGINCSSTCTCNTSNTLTCDKVNGSCTCKSGWNGENCESDINECLVSTTCTANSTCNNSLGSYTCDCNIGFINSGGNCQECKEGTFGHACTSSCTCNTSSTLTCDKVNGLCTCKNGWNGNTCSDDVNECQNFSICAAFANSACNNLPGTYSCDCNAGFFNSSGQCHVCPNNTYGIGCTSNCTCNTTNALTCDKVNGTCTCKNGWSGLTCDDDVDECQSPIVCDAKPNSTCANFPGSYFCVCNSGFHESNDLCEAKDKFQNYSVTVCFDISVDFSLNNKKDPRYIALLKSIQKTLAEHFNRSMGAAFYSIRVVSLRNGSVIADTELQVNKDKTNNPDGQVAKGLEDLASSPSLTVNGTVWNISEVKYNNKTVTVSQNLCDTFYQVTSCSDGQVCDDSDSVPKCSQIKDSNYQLIIGLSVGIPLFFVLVIIIVVCVVYNYKRRRSAYDRPNKRRQDNPEYTDLHVPKRVVRTQGETTPQYNTVRTVGEVYAEIGDVPDYFPTSHMSEHDYLRHIPLDTYSHGISTNITSQSNFRSGRSPAPDARSATSRENKASTYLHPTSAVYEGNGVHDLNYDSLRPVYYPTRPPTRNATNDREHRNYGGRRPTTHNIHRAHYK